ncbi:hypothetical protein BDE36_2751 [Arcticibacter tournemirensis]|uniref:Late embryogenesis abundant protein LEA-2 subgroup domain-containing protein n=1 Tax=Arcticibacter tournemirensis TaxID=699437 RepID=A0A5M9HDI0_9SPHI|nr:hypothetical protein [Arcticibacter tournemirensis]KAA8483328.1 hypothetical protein F1649_09050 [Arcticibacter tournemirensis]TQM50984.1 hypothetical protein BDE36_2751 [Arcticibacter tournemirensis]
MKKILFFALLSFSVAGCGINKQIERAKAFEKCRYEITSADSIYIADMNVMQVVNSKSFDILRTPRLALALLRKDVPLEGRLNLQIKNPSAALAAINQFEYKILIKNHELAGGLIDRAIKVEPNGGTTLVPIRISTNIYKALSDSKAQQDIMDFLSAAGDEKSDKKSILTIKIKPTIGVGNKMIKYPGYITIDKEITRKILL